MQNWFKPLKIRLSSVTKKIFSTSFKVLSGLYGIFSAYFKAARTGHKLPPGALRNLQAREFQDRYYLLKLSKKYGQIFKATRSKRLIVCVVGLAKCKRLLSEYNDNLRPESVSLTSLFPKGILRMLEGEDHRKYRQSLVKALESSFYERVAGNYPEIIHHELKKYAITHREQASTPQALTKTLDDIATGLLINMYFGVAFRSKAFEQLMEYYRRLGPTGFVWSVGIEQKRSFKLIRDFLRARLTSSDNLPQQSTAQSVIQRIHDDHHIDEVCLGNLIYMVEMGRFDLCSLFRWLIFFGAREPEILDRIAAEDIEQPIGKMTLSSAFVQETLRLEQSERLMRSVKNDFVFDGYLFPANAFVRLCIWESHKDEAIFPEPFAFHPDRFLNEKFGIAQYAPFGLDQHRCPMSDVVIKICTLFIKLLVDKYQIESVVETTPNRGTYHWQPGKQFTVNLIEKATQNY